MKPYAHVVLSEPLFEEQAVIGKTTALGAQRTMQQMPQFGPLMQSITALDSFDKRRREYKRVGWIYAARNPSFVDPVFKIGQSKVSPAERVRQLSSSTSVYRPFELVYWVHVSNRERAEGYAHQLLQECRVNPGREFFAATVVEVARALDQAAASFPIPLGRTARSGFLRPGLAPITVPCPRCDTANRAPRLLVPIRISCGNCSEMLGGDSKTRPIRCIVPTPLC